MDYIPQKWLILQMGDIQKVLAGWQGGYLDSDEWRLSSGVTNITEDEEYYIVENYSGSIYKCRKGSHGTTHLSGTILDKIIKKCNDEGVAFSIIEDIVL